MHVPLHCGPSPCGSARDTLGMIPSALAMAIAIAGPRRVLFILSPLCFVLHVVGVRIWSTGESTPGRLLGFRSRRVLLQSPAGRSLARGLLRRASAPRGTDVFRLPPVA